MLRTTRFVSRFPLVITCLLAAGHYASFADAQRPLITDIRYYVYFAAQTAAGAVPFGDFFDIKTPLATFVGALLIHLGELVGLYALVSIRLGYLMLAAAIPVVYFAIQRRLAQGDCVPGFLAALSCMAFSLLGYMPSIGNVPKLLMALFVPIGGLLVAGRRWKLAGLVGGLAFLDWQIGILLLCGVAVAALCEDGKRIRSLTKVAIGGFGGLAPFLFFFFTQGALGEAFHQTIGSAFARGASTSSGFARRFDHLLSTIGGGCGPEQWWVAVGVIGFLIYPLWIHRHARQPTSAPVIVFAVYHYGVVGFCLIDFQLYGDLFILLHTVTFFIGVAFIELYRGLIVLVSRLPGPEKSASGFGRQQVLAVAVCLLAFGTLRPALLRSDFRLPTAAARATLDDQIEVRQLMAPLIEGQKLAFVAHVETLFLADRQNDIPYVTWAAGDLSHYRKSPEEGKKAAWNRLIRETCPDVIVQKPWSGAALNPEALGYFKRETLVSSNAAYHVTLFVLRERSADRYRAQYCSPPRLAQVAQRSDFSRVSAPRCSELGFSMYSSEPVTSQFSRLYRENPRSG